MSGARASVLLGAAVLIISAWSAGLLFTRLGRRIVAGGIVAGVLAATGSVRIVFGLLLICSVIVTAVWALFTRETARKSLEELGGG